MRINTFLKGVAIGAGLMYLFDPSEGRRRRCRIRDRSVKVWNDTGDAIESTSRDIANRTQGAIHNVTGLVSPETYRRRLQALDLPLAPSRWSPTTRLLVTAAAGLLALYGTRKGGILGTALGAASIGIITTSASATELRTGFIVAPSIPTDYVVTTDITGRGHVEDLSEHLPRTKSD